MSHVRWFRLGDAVLCLDSDDAALRDRFDTIYGDCAVTGPGDLLPVGCRVRAGQNGVEVTFDDPEPLDIAQFTKAVFPDRSLALDCSSDGRRLRAQRDSEWRPFVANLAVSRTQRLQRHVMFFHAASCAIAGRGLLACGPKRSGKTTLALSLASRGHQLLGDELAAVRLPSRELLPVRRSLAVRQGPAAASARTALARLQPSREVFPDGELRERAAIARLFPESNAAPAPLTSVILLRTFAAAAAAEPATVTPAMLGRLTPLAASLWDRPAGAVTIQLLRLLAESRVWWLDAGPPEQTAELVEQLLETA